MKFHFRVYVLPILIALALSPVGVRAQLVGDPAGPRAGTVYVLRVTVPTEEALDALREAGFDIDRVGSDSAEVYATPGERQWLDDRGYVYEFLEQQPNPFDYQTGVKALGVYHNHAMMTAELQAYAAAFPGISRLFNLGDSVQGREIWALLITDNPDTEEDEPEFKYVGPVHGDEPVGAELCLFLIDRLLNDYGIDGRITSLVNETEIWIVPMANPDGIDAGTRTNANGFDLNRSFPSFPGDFSGTIVTESFDGSGLEPEVLHIATWTLDNSFALSANQHSGALVANYPYDHEPGIPSGTYAPAPDDSLFIDIALRYSTPNVPMFTNPAFPMGITNGSDWFSITGGMQDWNYRYAAVPELTLELSNQKTPPEASLVNFWADNEESMLAYMEAAQIGVRGVVTDLDTGDPVFAQILVDDNPQPVFTDPDVGDYHRLLLPGTYTIRITAFGYAPQEFNGVVVGSGNATRVDVALEPLEIPAANRWALYFLVVALLYAGFCTIRMTSLPSNRGLEKASRM